MNEWIIIIDQCSLLIAHVHVGCVVGICSNNFERARQQQQKNTSKRLQKYVALVGSHDV